jgi:hypothetical protein
MTAAVVAMLLRAAILMPGIAGATLVVRACGG